MDYGHPWDGLVTQFKFHGALDLTPALAACIASAVLERGENLPDLLLPVPLSPQRLRERGYNQAWELTQRVAASLRCRCDARLLLRIRHDPHQLALSPEQREANVHGTFAVEPLRSAELRGRRIALIDDVMTTGATLAEASRVLLQAGASEVHGWVLARTPRREDR